MNKTFLANIRGLILNEPLLCTPEYAETLAAVLGDRIGIDNSALSINSGTKREAQDGMSGSTRIIPIIGSMAHRSTGLEAMSGMTSYADLQAQVEEAMNDNSVKSILFDVASPGGQVAGAFDFRDYLMEQRGRKPMVSIARDTMASAAYLIGSATDKIYTTQTGQVGSIGVVAMHVDQSEKNAKDGVKPTFIYAGDYKTAGNPHAPLEGDALSYLQESVNDSYEMFIQAVAEARDLEPDAVRATQARVYRGKKAVDLNLADGIASFDVALTELATSAPRVYSINTDKKMNLMTPEELEKLKADHAEELAKVQSDNESLRAAILAEGYAISETGLEKKAEAEYLEVAGEKVDKASLPANVVAALESAAQEKADAELAQLASKEIPNFAVDEAKAILAIAKGDEKVLQALKAADAAMGSLMEETGAAPKNADFIPAQDQLESMVSDYMADNQLSGKIGKAKAYSAVVKTKEGAALEAQARKEK